MAYKALHHRFVSPLPSSDAQFSSSVSPAAAVSSILYETPLPSSAPSNRHVLNCLVQNEPGVLSRVSGILAARGFNIGNLVVCTIVDVATQEILELAAEADVHVDRTLGVLTKPDLVDRNGESGVVTLLDGRIKHRGSS
ncbi:acetolactate synthase, regulatory subunit [Elasticomyces elasticus]|nr:acetolactate synthase, regulatory subunit [Elasticomyces elasticus]